MRAAPNTIHFKQNLKITLSPGGADTLKGTLGKGILLLHTVNRLLHTKNFFFPGIVICTRKIGF